MTSAWKVVRKLLLWAGIVVLVILAGVGLMFFDRIIPQKDAVTFSFAGWTNDAKGARVAVLSISNHSEKPITYFADVNRQPRCSLMIVTSRQKQGNVVYTSYTNLTEQIWTGYTYVPLPSHTAVNCLLPWHDQFTNGSITFGYMPEPNMVQRLYEQVSLLIWRQWGRPGKSVPLAGAPWTNTVVRPF